MSYQPAPEARSRPDCHRTTVRVDASRQMPLRRIWRYVGYDEPNYTYTPGGRALLLKLGRLSDGRTYGVRRHVVDDTHGNAHTAWVRVGEPQRPSSEQLRALRRAAEPEAEEETTSTATDGKVALTLLLQTHAACLVELIP